MAPPPPFATPHMSATSTEASAHHSSFALDMTEERARLAARALADALLLGLVGDAILRVSSWGTNMAIWSIAIVAAVVTLARRRYETLPSDAQWLLIPAVA